MRVFTYRNFSAHIVRYYIHQICQSIMVRDSMSSMAHAIISTLKQQEVEIEEVVKTMYENIKQYRADLRFSLPELKSVLEDLIQEHYGDTRQLVRELGEIHPMAILWEQRVEETDQMVSDALYLNRITMRNFEEDLEAWSDASSVAETGATTQNQATRTSDGLEDSFSAQTGSATQVQATEDGAATLLMAAETMQPTTTQVQVRVCKVKDAALSLPVGEVTRVDEDPATWPQTAPEEGGEQTLHTHGTTQPATKEVQVDACKANDASSDLPLGSTATEPVLPATVPSTGAAISLLNKLLARSRQVQRKLDRMTATPAGGPAAEQAGVARGPSIPAGRPGAVLDTCLAQAQSLLHKVDRMSAEVKSRSPRDIQVQVTDNKTKVDSEDVKDILRVEVRKSLLETLQWPSKYPKLFAQCPLRLRTGRTILLYVFKLDDRFFRWASMY